MMKRTIMIAALLVFAASAASHATLGIGARALGMGGAYSALADDETAIYWNPSMLNYQEKNFSISLPTAGLSYISNLSRSDIDNLSGDEIETLGNAELQMEGSGMVGFHVNRWGVAAMMDIDGMT